MKCSTAKEVVNIDSIGFADQSFASRSLKRSTFTEIKYRLVNMIYSLQVNLREQRHQSSCFFNVPLVK